MSISALLGARLGLEDLTEDEIEVEEGAPLDGSETVEGEMLETGEAEAEVEEVGEQVDVLAEDGEALEAIAVLLDKAVKKGGMGELGLEAINLNLRGIARRANVGNEISASLESFTAKSTPLARTEATLEGVKEMIKGWWASFKAAMSKIFTKIKDFFSQLFNSVPRIAKRASDILVAAGRVSGKNPANDKITVSGRDKLCIDNKFANGSAIAGGVYQLGKELNKATLFEQVAQADQTFKSLADDAVKNTPLTAEAQLAGLVDLVKTITSAGKTAYKGGKYAALYIGDYATYFKDLPAEMKTPSEAISALNMEYIHVVHGSPIESSGEEETLTIGEIKDIAGEVIEACRQLTAAKAFSSKISASLDKLPKEAEKYFDKISADSKEDDAIKKLRSDNVKDDVKLAYRILQQGARISAVSYSHTLRTSVAALNYAAKSLDQYKEGKKKDEDKKDDSKKES